MRRFVTMRISGTIAARGVCRSSFLVVILFLAAPTSGQTAVDARRTLPPAIDRILAAPPFQHAIWGIRIEQEDGSTLYEHDSHVLLIPASNRKLFAAAAVAACIGFDHQFETELFLDGPDLVLRGGGDPSLGGRWSWNRDEVFAPFVAALRSRGIANITGDLVADVSRFDRATIPDSWKVGNLGENYAAPVDALAYNENVVGVVVDHCETPVLQTDPDFVVGTTAVVCAPESSATVRSDDANAVRVSGPMKGALRELPAIASPARYAAQALRESLRRSGIEVRGSIRIDAERRASGERIAVIPSPPVSSLLEVMLKPSQNLYAEMLFKNLSAGARPATYADSRALERQFLVEEAGVADSEFRFVDGSGLSSDDLVTPAAVVQLLRWMDAPVRRGAWWQLLAAPGEEGTLKKRLLPLAARLRGKTGSIAGVNALSGICRGTGGRTRYFSIILNHHTAGTKPALAAIDAIAEALADF